MPVVRISDNCLVYSESIQACCVRAYPRHPSGCPNYGHKPGCPPGQPLIDRVLDVTRPICLIYTEFDIGAHAARMRVKHPHWSETQVYCCLYWQPKARKEHRVELMKAARLHNRLVTCPEAHGVNLDVLMRDIGAPLEWPPRETARLVSLGGTKRRRRR